jgi:CDP-diacylglycerol--serine O-phosphatidyltransferase
VQYAKVPTVGLRTWSGRLGILLVIGTLAGVIFFPPEFFFPALMCYVAFGIGRTVFLGLLDRLPSNGYEEDVVDPDAPSAPRRRRKSRRASRFNTGPTDGREDSSL